MSNPLQACLYNTNPTASSALATSIRELSFVRLVAQADSVSDLLATVHDQSINLIFFHLDPKKKEAIEAIEATSQQYPGVAMIAISKDMSVSSIMGAMRAGCDQFVASPIDKDELAGAVARAASKRLWKAPRSRCICVTGASGGAGATSIASNLALEIALSTDRECALVDLDHQFGDVALNFDCDPKYSFQDLAAAAGELDSEILMATLTSLPCKVSILSRPEAIDHATPASPDAVHRVLDGLSQCFENVVVDIPNHLDAAAATALSMADRVIIVAQRNVPSVRNAKRYFLALLDMGILEDRIEIVVNRDDGRPGRVSLDDISEIVNKPLLATIPSDYEFVARSIDFGRPVASLDENSKVRVAIRDMARKLTSLESGSEVAPATQRGFLSRLLAKSAN